MINNLKWTVTMTGRPTPGGARAQGAVKSLKTKIDPTGELSQRLAAETQEIGRAGLAKFLEVLSFENDDDQEEIAVYEVLAGSIADDLGYTVEEVFPCILVLCGGDRSALPAQLPAPDDEVIAAIRNWLVMIRVQYDMPRGGPYSRTVEIAFRGPEALRRRTIKQRLRREGLPSSVREQQFRAGRDSVAFRLYPRSA
jgi:hypothetical protein